MNFIFREAVPDDIAQIQIVRHAVKENVLSDPAIVTDKDCEEYLTARGKGWVCELNENIIGFAIADLKGQNIWALFVRPEYESNGIGKKLHALMLDWYFGKTKEKIELGTAPGTRAVLFYTKQGWTKTGVLKNGEVKFEMTAATWQHKA